MKYTVTYTNKKSINYERAEAAFATIDEATRFVQLLPNDFDAVIWVNGILMPNTEDDTFFYASVKAAEEGKVWCEMSHTFASRQWVEMFEGGCFDTGDPEDEAEFWTEALENIYTDVHGYVPVTGEDGVAIVRDEDLAKKCEQRGWDVLPCGNPDELLDDGSPNEWWEIRPAGAEEEYFEEVYAGGITLDEDNDDSEDDEPITPPSQMVCDIQTAIRDIVRGNFETKFFPTNSDVPFVGYTINEDEGEVAVNYFTEARYREATGVIEFSDIMGYTARADEFLGWKRVR